MKKFILFLTCALHVSYSYCCSCSDILGLSDAKSVFEGFVTGVRKKEVPFIHYEIEFKVQKTIKGHIKSETIVVDVPCLNEACCGINFTVGRPYAVYTFMNDGRLSTNLCTETHLMEK